MDVPSKKQRNEDDKKKYEQSMSENFSHLDRKSSSRFVTRKKQTKCIARKYPELPDKSSPMYIGCAEGVQGFRAETLTAHLKSRRHVVSHTRLLNDQRPEDRPLEKIFSRISQESQARLEKLFNTAHYIAKENLCLQKYTSICKLLEKNQVDLGPNYRNPKTCKTFVSAMPDTERDVISCNKQGSFQFSQMGAQIQESLSESLFLSDMLDQEDNQNSVC